MDSTYYSSDDDESSSDYVENSIDEISVEKNYDNNTS